MAWTLVYTARTACVMSEIDRSLQERSGAGARTLRGEPERCNPRIGFLRVAITPAGDHRMVYCVIACRIDGRTVSPGRRRSVSDELSDTCSPRRGGTFPGKCQSGRSLRFVQDSLPSARKRVAVRTRHMDSSIPRFLARNLGTERFVQLRTLSKTTETNARHQDSIRSGTRWSRIRTAFST